MGHINIRPKSNLADIRTFESYFGTEGVIFRNLAKCTWILAQEKNELLKLMQKPGQCGHSWSQKGNFQDYDQVLLGDLLDSEFDKTSIQ